MSETMHVIALKDTGHILAALVAMTSGDPPGLETIVGSDLPIASVRSTENGTDGLTASRTLVPASLLELKSVPLDESVIANPMNHAIDGGRIVRLPPLAAPVAPTLNELTVTLDGGTIDTKGFAVVARMGDPTDQLRVQSGTFVDTNSDNIADPLVLPLSILPDDTPAAIEPSGNYDIFVALEGMRPYWAMHVFP